MVADHATNYSYKNCLFCIINYFELSSTVIDTPKIQNCSSLVDDGGDKEMIM